MDKMQNDLHSERMFPKIWTRYVDDIFYIVRKDKVKGMLEILNKVHRDLSSSMEISHS